MPDILMSATPCGTLQSKFVFLENSVFLIPEKFIHIEELKGGKCSF